MVTLLYNAYTVFHSLDYFFCIHINQQREQCVCKCTLIPLLPIPIRTYYSSFISYMLQCSFWTRKI